MYDAAPTEVLGHVLTVFCQLQAAADVVRQAQSFGRRLTEHVKDEVTDRVGGEPGVAEEIFDRLVSSSRTGPAGLPLSAARADHAEALTPAS